MKKSVHYWIFMRGRGWFDLWVHGTAREIESWRVRQLKIRDVIQVKACEGCVECGQEAQKQA